MCIRDSVTTAMVAAIAGLGLSLGLVDVVRTERYLGRVSAEIRRLEPEARAVDGLAEELERKRRVLAALASAEEGRVPALSVLRELTSPVTKTQNKEQFRIRAAWEG